MQLVYTPRGIRNNEVHQNVLGPATGISDVLGRETDLIQVSPFIDSCGGDIAADAGSLCDEAAILRDMIKWTQYINTK